MSYNSNVGIGASSEPAAMTCWLLLQDTTGTSATDQSSDANPGTISGMGANPTTTTGPTSYLTSAFDFDGTDDIVTLDADTVVGGANPRTYACWVRADSGADNRFLDVGSISNAGTGTGFNLARGNTGADLRLGFFGHGVTCGNNSFPIDTWMHVAVRVNDSAADTGDVDVFINGVKQTLTTTFGSAVTLNTDNTTNRYLGGGRTTASGYEYFNGKIAEYIAYSSALSDADIADLATGPEPEVTTAPTISGSTPSGSTLTCSGQAAALPSPFASGSNGTITWSYQWTNSVSGDIGGETSSTYTSQASDVGDGVGCDVLPSNDGGSSAAEETSSSNTITVTSAASTVTRMNLQLFIPTRQQA